MIIDSPIVSGSFLSTGSLSQIGNAQITGSLTVSGSSISLVDGAFSGSGANLYGIPSTGITGLNLSQISSGSVSASISPNFGLLINTRVSASNFTGSYTGSLTGIATSASFAYTASSAVNATSALTASSADNLFIRNTVTASAALISGTITAQTLVVSTVSSSVTFSSGSNIFGNSTANTQTMTGSLNVSGSATIVGRATVTDLTGSLFGTASWATNFLTSSVTSASYALTASSAISSSVAQTSSFVNTLNQNVIISGSFTVFTGSAVEFLVTNTGTKIGNALSDSHNITGSLSVTGSITGSLSGSITGSLFGTSSQAVTASYAAFALTSSYSLGGSGFPFSGSAVITGSLIISGSGLTITGSLAVSSLTTGSGVRYVIADANGNILAQTASAAIFTTQQNIATAGQTVFPITNGYSTGYVTVFVNGTKLNASEFTDTSGTNIVLATGSMVNDVVEFQRYLPAAGVSNNSLRTINFFTASAGQTNFTVNYTPGLLDVFYNGSKLDNTEYTAANGTSITLASASAAGDKLEVDVYSYQVGAFSGIGGSGAANQLAYFNTSNSITGSNNFTVSGSAIIVTGSLIVSGSGTFTNIGPSVFSGSVTSTSGFTGSFSGNADSASLAANSLLLGGTGSLAFATTSSFTAASSSMSSRVTQIERVYATTGSNSFTANQSITGSLTVTGQIIAQTINVQQVTSSIVYSSGSNVFGCDINSRQTFTGSFYQTGSLAYFSNCVGIGTSTPDAVFHAYCVAGGANALLAHFQNGGGGTAIATIKIGEGVPESQYGVLGHYGVDNSFRIGNINGNLAFHAGNSTTCGTNLYNQCERMIIYTSGITCFACQVCAPFVSAGSIDVSTGGASSPTAACVGYGIFGYSGVGLGISSGASGGNQGIGFFICGVERGRWITNGALGIGTLCPTSPLTIKSTNRGDTLRLSISGSSSTGECVGVTFGSSTYDKAQIISYNENSGNAAGTLTFWTGGSPATTDMTERMRITCAGKVIIGGTDATDTGNFRVVGICQTSYTRVAAFYETHATGIPYITVGKQSGEGADTATVLAYNTNDNVGWWGVAGDSYGTGIHLKRGSKVGIGISAPLRTLEVAGANACLRVGPDYFTANGSTDRDYIELQADGFNTKIISPNEVFTICNPGGGASSWEIDIIAGSGGVKLTNGATSWSAITSDRRKKKNFETTQGLTELMQIEPVKYHFEWDEDCLPKRLGFIAQNIQPLIPEMVNITKEKAPDGSDYLTITPDYILPVLTKAIQEQQCTICSQASIINILKACIGIA